MQPHADGPPGRRGWQSTSRVPAPAAAAGEQEGERKARGEGDVRRQREGPRARVEPDGGAGDEPPRPKVRGYDVPKLNREWALVLMGSKAVIIHEQDNGPIEDRVRVLTVDAFRAWFLNRYTQYVGADGKIKEVTWADRWLRERNRRQYRGIEFRPSPEPEAPTKASMSSAPTLDAVTWLADTINRHKVAPGEAGATQPGFGTGRIGLMTQGVNSLGVVAREEPLGDPCPAERAARSGLDRRRHIRVPRALRGRILAAPSGALAERGIPDAPDALLATGPFSLVSELARSHDPLPECANPGDGAPGVNGLYH